VVPIIGMADQTNLTNFSGDKKAWPVYMTIGNLPSTIRNRPGSMAILLLGLLPIPPKLAKSSRADKLQRLINADTLRGVFELIFAPLNGAAQEGAPIDCADGKIRRCFPIMSGWNADHMENVTLQGIKSNACRKCEVPPEEFGSRAGHHPARDYARHERYERKNPSLDSATHDAAYARYTNETHGIKRAQNVFQGLVRVSTPDLHKPDMLHTIYLGLFKHMMDWIQRVLKKQARQQAFDDTWKALPSYPGFVFPKKAYREVTQWQGKKMRNLGRCLLGVLAVALRQPDSTQVQPFRRALTCVRSLLDLTMIAQYRSHTPETISYMEEYATQFHDREEENDQRMEFIHSESNFNFVKMHLISPFRDHISIFGHIPKYSTEYGELAHKEQIKDGWRRSNKIDAVRQRLSSYGRQHAIRMRILNLEFLQRAGADLPTEVVEHLEKTRPAPTPPAHRGILKGRRDSIHDVVDFGRACDISPETICRELIPSSRLSLPPQRRLPENPAILRALPVELLTQLEIPVLVFQESGVYEIHSARCTGARLFHNQTSRNDCFGYRLVGRICMVRSGVVSRQGP